MLAGYSHNHIPFPANLPFCVEKIILKDSSVIFSMWNWKLGIHIHETLSVYGIILIVTLIKIYLFIVTWEGGHPKMTYDNDSSLRCTYLDKSEAIKHGFTL